MENETAPTPPNEPPKEEVMSFKRVTNYLYNAGYQAGHEAGYKQAKSNISFSRRAYIYSGHFVFGMLAGAFLGMGVSLAVMKMAGLL